MLVSDEHAQSEHARADYRSENFKWIRPPQAQTPPLTLQDTGKSRWRLNTERYTNLRTAETISRTTASSATCLMRGRGRVKRHAKSDGDIRRDGRRIELRLPEPIREL